MKTIGNAAVLAAASLIAAAGLEEKIDAPRFRYQVDCVGADGKQKWAEDIENLVTTAGGNLLLDTFFAGSAYTAAWYLGLKGAGSAALADTMTSHAAWAEVNPYTGNRPALAFSAAAAKSKAATVIAFSITVAGPTTVAGAFVASSNTGTTGTLYSAGDFATSRLVVAGDTLNVTLTVSV